MSISKERYAIVGTAQSWKQTPWTDTGLYIASLNDAYRLPGFVRADAWYDFHPLNKFHFVPEGTKGIHAHQVPAGYYVRPESHLDWLGRQAQTIPVWLHPGFREQHPAAATWPKAQAFPKSSIEDEYGMYFASSPAWMIAHAILQGARELHIYGIHLATESEYVEQRPNFEFLCGRVLGPRKVKLTVKDGLRRYETRDGVVVLPEASPVLSSNFQYAFQDRPRAALEPLRWDEHRYTVKRERALQALRTAPWWAPTAAIKESLWQLDALLADTRERLAHMQQAQLHQ